MTCRLCSPRTDGMGWGSLCMTFLAQGDSLTLELGVTRSLCAPSGRRMRREHSTTSQCSSISTDSHTDTGRRCWPTVLPLFESTSRGFQARWEASLITLPGIGLPRRWSWCICSEKRSSCVPGAITSTAMRFATHTLRNPSRSTNWPLNNTAVSTSFPQTISPLGLSIARSKSTLAVSTCGSTSYVGRPTRCSGCSGSTLQRRRTSNKPLQPLVWIPTGFSSPILCHLRTTFESRPLRRYSSTLSPTTHMERPRTCCGEGRWSRRVLV
mmetsp:Transcript_32171/g.75520  ORF Transcript_32171/g.75520 Transcript_32171/m.75520 type:complete len:268 (-) Transcript_32171:308-1111(-)